MTFIAHFLRILYVSSYFCRLHLLPIVILLFVSTAHADRIILLRNDQQAAEARVDLIRQAQHEIYAEYFSIWNDAQSVAGFSLLLEAAKRGVKVKILMDAISNRVPPSIFASLLQKGIDDKGNQNIEIKLYNPVFTRNFLSITHRDHAKLLIVDGNRMITGGRNVSNKYFGLDKNKNYIDLDVLLDGDAVKVASQDFLAVFESHIVGPPNTKRFEAENLLPEKCLRSTMRDTEICERRRKHLIYQLDRDIQRICRRLETIFNEATATPILPSNGRDWLDNVPKGASITYVAHKPDAFVSNKTAELTVAIHQLLAKANSEVIIITPYLVPTDEMLQIFKEAIENRNVNIKIITNSLNATDSLFSHAGYLHHKDELIEMGVELYEYNGPDTLHAKTILVDQSIGFVGSYNFNPRSAFLNREVGVFINSSPDNQFATDLMYEIEKFKENSLLVGKDGFVQNKSQQTQNKKKIGVKIKTQLAFIRLLMPYIKSQL
jgi:putative cardiolipin synthase